MEQLLKGVGLLGLSVIGFVLLTIVWEKAVDFLLDLGGWLYEQLDRRK